MQFNGKNLELVRYALECAISDLRTSIGLHPAPLEYEDEIQGYEEDIEKFKRLISCIDRKHPDLERLE